MNETQKIIQVMGLPGPFDLPKFSAMVAEACARACEERGAAYRNTKAPGWQEVDHESAQCAAAVRAKFPMPAEEPALPCQHKSTRGVAEKLIYLRCNRCGAGKNHMGDWCPPMLEATPSVNQ